MLIQENLDDNGVFSELFNDFWKVTRDTIKIGVLKGFDPSRYKHLSAYAGNLYKALIEEYQNIPNQVTQEELFDMFSYFWAFTKQFINYAGTGQVRQGAYWDVLTDASNAFCKRFNYEFAKKMMIEFLDETERRSIVEEKKEAPMCA